MAIRKNAILWISGVTLAVFLLAACRTASPTPKLQPTPTPAIATAPAPTSIATSAPTPTAPPSTPMLAATSTPTPTAPRPTVLATPSPTPTAPPATVTTAPTVKPDPIAGEKTFYAVGCIGCHTVQGVGGRVGPDLTDIAKRRDAAYIRQSEVDPKAYIVPGYPPVMPSAKELGLSDQDVENIIAWFQSLR